MAAVWSDTDSEDELPPGWEERSTSDGSVYYVNRATEGSQRTHPRTGKKKRVSGELPGNWERTSENGHVVYVDRSTLSKTFADPRLAFATEEKEHEMDFRQRFDGSTTALQVLHGIDLYGKVILITGSTSGIGFETAKSLSSRGAEVIVCGRTESGCKAAEHRISEENLSARIRTLQMDLSCLDSVKRAAATVKRQYEILDAVILNAGVMALGWTQTPDNYETVFQVNHLAQFYLIRLLEDRLRRGSRIVIVSSESHRFSNINRNNINREKLSPTTPAGYWDMMAYNNSKLCNVLFGAELQKRWGPRGVDVFVVHPGNLVSTNLTRNSCLYRLLFALVRPFTKSLQQAAATSVYAAVAPELAGSGGVYLNNCCPCEASREGRDENLARQLWAISEDLVSRTVSQSHSPS